LHAHIFSFLIERFNLYRHLSFALERLKLERVRFFWETPQVLDGLPAGHYPHIFHRYQRVQEGLETDLVVGLGEPGSVVEQSKRSSEIKIKNG